MTNRFAHTTGCIQLLLKQSENTDFDEQTHRCKTQIRILYGRSRILLLAIALGSTLFVSLLVIALFTTFFVNIDLQGIIIILFTVSLICLVASVVLFIQNISLTLKALTEKLRGQM
ncbi:DUF2721 domain-containing protein [Leptolyngbya sp. PL-A3]|nr:DUF2721 domain-containing protein [Leptolyngbya sp. FACHB-8]MBD2155883.1 DUF2721 domain-containing protein [Leptolyngbya sp. FACHB-16]